MAVSQECPALPSLYCNEAVCDSVSSCVDVCEHVQVSSSDSLIYDEDEDSVVSLFDSELDQMLESKSVSLICDVPEVVSARQEAVTWMLKVHAYYQFKPETACLSVNYLDRFLCSRALPQGKRWPLQLLSVACLALAAKMEETRVPRLLDLQTREPRFLFKPKTVQRMELLVMASLKWRLSTITPFNFLHYFIAKLSCFSTYPDCFSCVSSGASDLILSTCSATDFLEYPPSAIAAAVVFWVTNQHLHDQKWECLHNRLNTDMVKRCYDLIKRNTAQSPNTKQQKLEPFRGNQIGILEPGICRSCNSGTSRSRDVNSIRKDSLPSKC